MMLKKGVYRHFKGNHYRVIGIAKDSESLEEMVVYSSVSNSDEIWVRPVKMFMETITVDGKEVKRFEWSTELK